MEGNNGVGGMNRFPSLKSNSSSAENLDDIDRKKLYIYIVKQKQIIIIKINTMKKLNNKFNKLDTFEKIQVSIFGSIMTLLAGVVLNWGLQGFVTMAF